MLYNVFLLWMILVLIVLYVLLLFLVYIVILLDNFNFLVSDEVIFLIYECDFIKGG